MEKPHKNLEAWRQSMDLVVEIYEVTKKFPHKEIYGLTNQVRRAAISVAGNIAEAAARQTKKEFANFLHVSQGSLSELDTQIEIASRLGFIDDTSRQAFNERMEPIDKMITGLIRHYRRINRLLTTHF